VVDPSGAGDSFAGGFVGSLARKGSTDEASVRQAMIYGSVMASFCVESFGIERFKTLTPEEIVSRFREFQKICHFDPLDVQ
jgi:sugar/nucleoside kinase (ribokinase family)